MNTQRRTLGLLKAVATLGFLAMVGSTAQAAPIFGAGSYTETFTFQDQTPSTTMQVAFDGANYYTSSGGYYGSPYSIYDATGNFIAQTSPNPGIDFRSLFTVGSDVFARGYSSDTIYKQTSFGNFSAYLALSGGSPDAQSDVVTNGGTPGYVAQSSGVVMEWDAAGNFVGSTSLFGFGDNPGEADYPTGRGLVAVGNIWYTYNAFTEEVSAWDHGGNRLDTAILANAGTGFDSGFSFSYANNMFFVVDQANGLWRGYNVGLGGDVIVPSPAAWALMLFGLVTLAGLRRSFVSRA